MISLETLSTIDNTEGVTGQGHHECFPRPLTQDPWCRAQVTYGEYLNTLHSWITDKIWAPDHHPQ